MKKVILSLLAQHLLVGCTGYQNSFDCPPPPGLGCQSMTQINGHITENNGSADELLVKNGTSCEGGNCLKKEITCVRGATYFEEEGGETVQRVPERVAKIWLNGYINNEGDFEGSRYVYVALKDDTWRLIQREKQHD